MPTFLIASADRCHPSPHLSVATWRSASSQTCPFALRRKLSRAGLSRLTTHPPSGTSDRACKRRVPLRRSAARITPSPRRSADGAEKSRNRSIRFSNFTWTQLFARVVGRESPIGEFAIADCFFCIFAFRVPRVAHRCADRIPMANWKIRRLPPRSLSSACDPLGLNPF